MKKIAFAVLAAALSASFTAQAAPAEKQSLKAQAKVFVDKPTGYVFVNVTGKQGDWKFVKEVDGVTANNIVAMNMKY